MLGTRFSEFNQLIIAWLVLAFCFSARAVFFPAIFPTLFISSLIAVGAGFIGHELSHKFIAQRYGWKAGFKIWPQGLFLALFIAVISGGQFVFAAPGAVYIVPLMFGHSIKQKNREYGFVSLSGPLMNLVFSSIFLFVYRISNLDLVSTICYTGFYVNLFLACFNLIPFPPMDGAKIFTWSKLIWGLLTLPAWIALIIVLTNFSL